MTDLLADLVQARLPWLSSTLRSWYDEPRLARQLADGLAPESGRVGDEAFGAGFRDGVGLEIGEPLDWANRVVDLPDGGWAVVGIRFRGRDLKRPFVDVVATTGLPTPDTVAAVAEVVLPRYAAFDPLCLRVDAPDPDALVEALDADDRFGTNRVDQLVVAGLVSELRARESVPSYPQVGLRPGEPDVLAERVDAIYAELDEANPDLAEWARPESRDTLAECAEQGLLFEVLADGEPAGVVCAVRDDDHGMSGFCVQEICLDRRHLGRRLAPAVLQHLLDALPAGEGDVLWGTIHPDNAPSLRNSMSIGREVVGGYVWVTPAGLPGMP